MVEQFIKQIIAIWVIRTKHSGIPKYLKIRIVILAKDLEYAQRLRRGSVLPDDWDVPLTTQRSSYKNPVLLNKKALHIVSPIKSPNNLDPCGTYSFSIIQACSRSN